MGKYVADAGAYGVAWSERGFDVLKSGATVAAPVCSFSLDVDGLGCAIFYARYRHDRDTNANTTPEEKKEQARQACTDAERIYAMGRTKAHRAWLEG